MINPNKIKNFQDFSMKLEALFETRRKIHIIQIMSKIHRINFLKFPASKFIINGRITFSNVFGFSASLCICNTQTNLRCFS